MQTPPEVARRAIGQARALQGALATRMPPTPRDRALKARLDQVRTLTDLGVFAPDYEALLVRHYSAWLSAGDVVLDVGAHSGQHLRRFLDLVGPTGNVLAFEPLPPMFRRLRRNFPDPNVQLHKVALGRTSKQSTFVHARGAPAQSGLQERIYTRDDVKPEIITVQVRRMDNFTANLSRLDWIKIDVEGGEIDALIGGVRTLRRLRPVVSVEYGKQAYGAYGHTASTLFDLARRQRYVLLDPFLNVLDTRHRWLFACDSVYWDFLMVARERLDEVVRRLAPVTVRSP